MTSFRPHRVPADDGLEDQVPVRVLELELSAPIEPVSLRIAGASGFYTRALCLVRLHGRPLELVWLDPDRSGIDGREEIARGSVARQIWAAAGAHIRSHLAADGQLQTDSVPVRGLRPSAQPACVAARDAVRARARPASVVVATRERPAALQRCLESLLELDYPRYEIVVVDNAPRTSATRELVKRDRFRHRVRYVCEPRPGLAAAHNRGVAEASGTFIAFTDDDVTVDRLWLLELARGFGLADGVACVTGLITPAELETRAQLLAERLWGFNKGFRERIFDRHTGHDDVLYPYTAGTFGSGANMAFDAEVLRRLDGFDPAIGAGTVARGGDDLSMFFTVISAGYRLVYQPAAFVRHAHHADPAALERQAYGYGVGLTAFLTKAILDQPGRILELARLSPRGAARVLDPRGGRRARGSGGDGFEPPAHLTRAERRGMLYGPTAYLRSRRQARGYGRL
ncbi:MAG TPA: glycosyltransferase [Solirubrobacteraceae bacterium]|nr:glycosyltransferase [Solirubrobacteraceae bacterium]